MQNSWQNNRANKSLGQHFLVDQGVISDILAPLRAHSSQGLGSIIEIGPGPGALTQHLLTMPFPLKLIEKDERFAATYSQNQKEDQVLCLDALEVDYQQLKSFFKKETHLISNLPYNVAVPIILKYIHFLEITQMTLMTQKEVAEKILGSDPKEPMNSLHFILGNYFELKKIRLVKPGAFRPAPKVDSLVFHLTRISTPPAIDWEYFSMMEDFLRLFFRHRRKKISTNLKEYFPHLLEHLKDLGPVLDLRPGNISRSDLEKILQIHQKHPGNSHE